MKKKKVSNTFCYGTHFGMMILGCLGKSVLTIISARIWNFLRKWVGENWRSESTFKFLNCPESQCHITNKR